MKPLAKSYQLRDLSNLQEGQPNLLSVMHSHHLTESPVVALSHCCHFQFQVHHYHQLKT